MIRNFNDLVHKLKSSRTNICYKIILKLNCENFTDFTRTLKKSIYETKNNLVNTFNQIIINIVLIQSFSPD